MDIQYGIKITTGQTTLTDYSIGLVAGVIQWVTGRPNLDGWKEGIVSKGSFSPVEQAIEIARGGGYATMSGFSLKIRPDVDGVKTWKRIRDLGLNLIQADAVVYCWRDGAVTQDWTGKVADTEAAPDGFKLQFMDAFRAIHKPICTDAFNTTDFPDVPDSIKGKSIPIAIGRVAKCRQYPVVESETLETICTSGGQSYSMAPCTNYTTGGSGPTAYKIVHLKTVDKTFAANALAGKFLVAVKGGNETRRITGNGASSGGVTQVYIEAPFTTSIAADNVWSSASTNVWYFQISSISIRHMASNGAIQSFSLSSVGRPDASFYDEDAKTYVSVSDVIDRYSLTDIDGIGFPGFTLLSKPTSLDGSSLHYTFSIPSSLREVVETSADVGSVTGTRPAPNTGVELSDMISGSGGPGYTWIATSTGPNAQIMIPLKVAVPSALITSGFNNIYLAFDHDADFVAGPGGAMAGYAVLKNTRLVDYLGRTTDQIGSVQLYGGPIDVSDLPLSIIPPKYYDLLSTESGVVFENTKTYLKLNDASIYISRDIDIDAYPYIIFELTFYWSNTAPVTMTLTISELTLVGERSINLLSSSVYAKLTGDMFAGTWGGRRTATNPVLTIADAVEHLIRNYDGEPDAVDTAAFDALSDPSTGTRKDWAIGRQLIDKANTFDLCRELARFGFFGIVPTTDGKRAPKAWLEYGETMATHDATTINAGSMGPREMTALSDVFNDLKINFAWNPGSENYDRYYHITRITEAAFPAESDPEWKTYAVGFTDAQYATAAALWAKCHLSWQRYGLVQSLPDELANCPWFPDVVTDFGLTEANNSALLYLIEGASWWPFRKDLVSYDVPNTAANAALELLDSVTVNDVDATAGLDESGWIVRKAIVPGAGDDDKDYIELTVMFAPVTT